jgi:hypothetical protein
MKESDFIDESRELVVREKKPRDMYISLYLKNLRVPEPISEVPNVDFNENWLKCGSIDYADLFATIEFNAV